MDDRKSLIAMGLVALLAAFAAGCNGEAGADVTSPAPGGAATTNDVTAGGSAAAANDPDVTEGTAMVETVEYPIQKITRTEADWKQRLTEMQYYVMREHGTERAGTGELAYNKRHGVYACAACGLPLYSSETKYESGTGWPSFWQAIDERNVGTQTDRSLFMTRTEVHCARCEGHLGHVFPDGPRPTGMRHCINSASLVFIETPEVEGTENTGG